MPNPWNPRVTHDPTADAAYISLQPPHVIQPSVAASRPLSDLGDLDAAGPTQVVLDFDDNGHLVGIEVLMATRLLHPELLALAER
jgi:uncharacterized protein YuzE